ncbi:MAG: DUF3368 domain-containing protein [Acidobacteriota bacterium]
MDDRRAVFYARALGIPVVRTPMVYITANRRGLIRSVREKLDRLREQGFWLKQADYETILRELGEL